MATFNPTYAQQLNSYNPTPAENVGFDYLLARVTHIVQGPFFIGTTVPDSNYKNPSDLGTITFQLLTGLQDRTLDTGGNNVARPMYSAIKQYPLEGEIVLLFPGPSRNMNENRDRKDFFYTLPYNLWNFANHNAFPDLGDYGAFVGAVKRNYQNSSETNQPVNRSATGSLNMPLGPNFPEKKNIRALKQFTGDVTLEGRWGNSIRFGSTTVPADQNSWSKSSEPGKPITIIRNGQGRQENNISWIPTIENINRDPSSIYLTEGQEIVINDINNNFSLASLDVNLNRSYEISIPIQQQLTLTDNTSVILQDEIILQAGRGTSTPPQQPTVNNISDNNQRPVPPPNPTLPG